ncbi:tetratricopeptide repeat protein [Telluria mixta]|uniref:Tetratricopeptide repeat protein n=1 Tax=Telluria mixta TaxID=34071 RepID=A0ABT2C3S3_9BURK|nr:tetratricopeptide repeat protein [Telluria mixta]MCS0632040.1 tetratricopeptide repeat protein [Telluria mixta]WEM95282.1 tetratricopeptide repeat protein [Telluria mixta]
MSLINKMLQDLDARGTPKDGELPGQVKPVERPSYRPNRRLIVAAVGGAVAAVALGWLGWSQLQRAPRPAPAAPAPVAAVQVAPVVTGPVQAAPVVTGPVQAPVAAPVEAPPAVQSTAGETEGAPAPKHMTRAERRAERKRLAEEKAAARKAEKAAKTATVHAKDVAPMEPDSAEAREARRAMAQALAARGKSAKKTSAAMVAAARAAAHDDAAPKGKRSPQGRQETGAQRAEGEYRRALASLQEGRMIETVASLEQALKYEPTHEAARQTLVGLLIEANRNDEAMRQLQMGLTLDPRQPAMAMLLARLQIERGGNGIDTLMRTLPYAGNDADYHAFLAAALARQQRHREAAEQYHQAVRAVPSNSVWWMGLGISLQAEKRNGEALEAFQRARAGGGLSQELQGFVERRIQQLSH